MTLQPADLDRLEQLAREAQEAELGALRMAAQIEFDRALSPAVVSELVAAARLGLEPRTPYGVVPAGCRLILASEHLLADFGTRTERGERITAEWGEPRPEGWYEPLFTVHAGDPAGSLDAAWAAAEGVLPKRSDGGGAWDSSGGVGLSLNRLNARAYAAEWGEVHVIEDTPAAALLALAEALRGRGTP